MLPFLKKDRANGGIATINVTPESDKSEDHDGMEGVRAAAADLIKAVHMRDEAGVAEAIRAAFDILDSMPHVEGEHLDEEGNE